MPNFFNKLFGSFASKARSFSIKAAKRLTENPAKRQNRMIIEDRAKDFTSSLSTFTNKPNEPTYDSIDSIMRKKPERTFMKRKEILTAPGVKFGLELTGFDKTARPYEKRKSGAQEMIRSGKTKEDVDEMKKEWLMEEVKARKIFMNSELTYEEARKSPVFEHGFEKAEKKWDKQWEKDKDKLIPSFKAMAETSLLQESKEKEKWIKSQISFFDREKRWKKKHLSLNDLQTNYPDWFAKKEKEYYTTKEVSAFMGLAIKTFDKDLENLLGKDQIADMETRMAILGGGDPKKIFTAMSLDIINFEDIANIGQDVYIKNGKIYYRGFEIDDQYLSDAGNQTAMVTDLMARFIGAAPTYGALSGLIKKGVFTMARAKDVPGIFKGGQKLAQGVQWASKTAPVLTELTAFNTFEELAEVAIRKGTGQDYTFSNFIAGIAMGAGMSGTFSILGRNIDTVDLKSFVREMEANVKESGSLETLRGLELQGRDLNSLFMESQNAFYKKSGRKNIRPGIDVAAPLPTPKPALETPSVKDFEKYKGLAPEIKFKNNDDMKLMRSKETGEVVGVQNRAGDVKRFDEAPEVALPSAKTKIPNDLFSSEEGVRVFTEMQTSKAGERIVTDEGTTGVSSTFPDWVPSDLKSRKLFDQVEKHLMGGTVPKGKKAGELYQIVHQEMLGGKTPVPTGISKVGASIRQKMIEKKMGEAFGGSAEFTKITIEDQARRAIDLVDNNIDGAIRILKGKEPLPEGLRGSSVIMALEDYALKTGDAQLMREIAISPLTAETSIHAQELRLLAERSPFSPIAKMKEVIRFREKAVKKKQKGHSPVKIKRQIKIEIQQTVKKVKIKKNTWAALVDELTC